MRASKGAQCGSWRLGAARRERTAGAGCGAAPARRVGTGARERGGARCACLLW